MIKHVFLSSITASMMGSLFSTLVCLPFYGMGAIALGMFSFPVALIWCLLSAYPLINLKPKLSKNNYFLVFLGLGFTLGVITPSAIIGSFAMPLSIEIVLVYGSLGIATSLSAWFYVYRNVHL